ncbi:hypothetical protein GCM10010452_00850 [Crossiella cryophila]
MRPTRPAARHCWRGAGTLTLLLRDRDVEAGSSGDRRGQPGASQPSGGATCPTCSHAWRRVHMATSRLAVKTIVAQVNVAGGAFVITGDRPVPIEQAARPDVLEGPGREGG